jgi:hypothetical protein
VGQVGQVGQVKLACQVCRALLVFLVGQVGQGVLVGQGDLSTAQQSTSEHRRYRVRELGRCRYIECVLLLYATSTCCRA